MQTIGRINKSGLDYTVQQPFNGRDSSSTVIFREKDIIRIYFNNSQKVIIINFEL